jgi:hypothetical protein
LKRKNKKSTIPVLVADKSQLPKAELPPLLLEAAEVFFVNDTDGKQS